MLGRTSFTQAARLRRIPRPLRTIRPISDGKGKGQNNVNVDDLIPERPPTWLTRKLQENPKNLERFLKITNALGMGSPSAKATNRTFVLYERVCAIKADEEKSFWRDECSLPPTFQSWFTVITLHIWMMTVRFRALPQAYGKRYADSIVDHFFQDVDDRVRAIMQPSHDHKPYIFTSTFYINPNAPKTTDKKERLARAPDRLVTQQLKIFKEQWTGFALSPSTSDSSMATWRWRGRFGGTFSVPVALLGLRSRTIRGQIVNPTKIDFEKEAVTDDDSGVHDFSPAEADKYLAYPELMLDVVQYIRRELVRLEALSDEEIIDKDWREMRFGRVRQNTTDSEVPPTP
ncbi:hypothetical protein MVEN_00559200 [Mycena venus]|uniref:Ubiquinol-cytochrome c chaperone domain-containing protein n=1 Tax=Mycena venus TaxID=2733690 RepID=A0A8H6YNA2_9AGAR|nr:hypothetical protein MVEN_00559200 [Mycena venus]